jgi:hypothetical protein
LGVCEKWVRRPGNKQGKSNWIGVDCWPPRLTGLPAPSHAASGRRKVPDDTPCVDRRRRRASGRHGSISGVLNAGLRRAPGASGCSGDAVVRRAAPPSLKRARPLHLDRRHRRQPTDGIRVRAGRTEIRRKAPLPCGCQHELDVTTRCGASLSATWRRLDAGRVRA